MSCISFDLFFFSESIYRKETEVCEKEIFKESLLR